MRYRIVCPHCDVEHPLLWGGKSVAYGFKWDGSDPTTVRHVCPHCRGPSRRPSTCASGTRVRRGSPSAAAGATTTTRRSGSTLRRPCRPPRHAAFVEFWTAYSPQREWVDIVREFLAAKTKADAGETGPLETFVNETLAQYWKVEMDKADEHALAKRAEAYRLRTVPQSAVVLVAGVDVQDNRWEVVVWGIGRGEECGSSTTR
jgi:phage terminase large subunit GpA-like protein